MPTASSRARRRASFPSRPRSNSIIADKQGESFKVTLSNGDYVQVSPPVPSEFKGNVPLIVTEAWQALKPAAQKAHVKSGLIRIEPLWGRATGGRVTIKVC
jgi:hypothetical protein